MNTAHARELLARGDLHALFIEELGWDHHSATLSITVEDSTVNLHSLAQKRGMVAYECPTPAGKRLPDYAHRRKIEHQVAKSTHEHLIVFTDTDNQTQIWQWVKREIGKPVACREHLFHQSQPGDALLQKLGAIAFTLEEEERISLPDVTSRARTGFDVEKVTKRFYERFQKEHAAFLKFISGITESDDREWYASVMLNRLMFVYFIQRKGFLDGDSDYLRNRLTRMRAEHGEDKFYSFYRFFLLRLFHEGFGGKTRSRELEKLLGRIPYLNGGLFDVHELEKSDRYGETIKIPDQAFTHIFDYFDQYQWHLDERPLRADDEINPDVLGYIFEKYVNQKQMGAYYTKEDITEYISKNTVLPFLFDATRAKCKVAFENPQGPTVWDLLKENPDRYIYLAVRHGNKEALPTDIAEGLNPQSLNSPVGDGPIKILDLRKGWNSSAPETHALPTETWREVIARRTRYAEIKVKLVSGEVCEVSDLITLNLDIRQFAQDIIENCEGPDLLRAFWHAIENITILDPMCGSGAFLFAALNILEPLYESCLGRMEAFVEDLARSEEKHRPEKYSDFRKVLECVAAHPNRRYFIFKSIILNNLFGVDIMEEAVEICKLRLFLKLAAQIEPNLDAKNLGVEPLPDIDFNIRTGNSLVGYATYDEVKRAITSTFDFDDAMTKIAVKAEDLQQTFDKFRRFQTEDVGSVPTADKQEVQNRLRALESELNYQLAAQYGIKMRDKTIYAKWVKSHKPFHWFIQFYGILARGGFDVIIGNPPYVELSKVNEYRITNYKTLDSGNLYALCIERSGTLLCSTGYMGVIVPLSGFSTRRMSSYQEFVWSRFNSLALSFYSGDAHPSVLFDGVKYRLSIIIATNTKVIGRNIRVSDYLRWYADERPTLFTAKVAYTACQYSSGFLRFGKTGTRLAEQVTSKLLAKRPTLIKYLRQSGKGHIAYHRSPVFWIRSMDFEPFFKSPAKNRSTDHLKDLYFQDVTQAQKVGAFLNASLFYFWFTARGNCRNISGNDIESFPVGDLDDRKLKNITKAFARLMTDLKRHSKRRVYVYEAAGRVEYDEFYPDQSKTILDEIDTILASHYGYTAEELDFILNYDIKYRLGRGTVSEEE